VKIIKSEKRIFFHLFTKFAVFRWLTDIKKKRRMSKYNKMRKSYNTFQNKEVVKRLKKETLDNNELLIPFRDIWKNKIIFYLCNNYRKILKRVCKTFYFWINEIIEWKININNYNEYLENYEGKNIIKIYKLKIFQYEEFEEDLFKTYNLNNMLKNIKKISLSGDYDISLINLLPNNIENISLMGCNLKANIIKKIIFPMFLKTLKLLDFESDEDLRIVIPKGLTKLTMSPQIIEIKNLPESLKILKILESPILDQELNLLPKNLEKLKLYYCDFKNKNKILPTSITTLKIHSCYNLGNQFLDSITKNIINLKIKHTEKILNFNERNLNQLKNQLKKFYLNHIFSENNLQNYTNFNCLRKIYIGLNNSSFKFIPLLPKGIKILIIKSNLENKFLQITAEDIALLPNTIIKLTLKNMSLSEYCFSNINNKIKKLIIDECNLHNLCFDNFNLGIRSLTLYYSKNNNLQFKWFSKLPTSLEKINIIKNYEPFITEIKINFNSYYELDFSNSLLYLPKSIYYLKIGIIIDHDYFLKNIPTHIKIIKNRHPSLYFYNKKFIPDSLLIFKSPNILYF